MEFISVVIPLYNKQSHIRRAVLSVLEQSYRYFEIIVIDDGSTDDSAKEVQAINDSRITLIRQTNKGVSEARNEGIRHAKYTLIAFLDADDEYCSNFLENIIQISNKYPSAKMIGTNYYIATGNDIREFKTSNVPKDSGVIKNFFEIIQNNYPFSMSSIVFHKEVFTKIGGFSEQLIKGEDHFMQCITALYYQVAYINEPLAIIHHDSENRSYDTEITNYFPLIEYINETRIPITEFDYYYAKEFAYKKNLENFAKEISQGNKKNARFYSKKTKDTEKYKKRWFMYNVLLFIPNSILEFIMSVYRKVR